MAWTPWRKVADEAHWYVDHALRIPVCYELAIGSMLDRDDPEVLYVGAALSEATELEHFEAGEHPLAAQITPRLVDGNALYYRATGAPTLERAEELREERLQAGRPPLNQS